MNITVIDRGQQPLSYEVSGTQDLYNKLVQEMKIDGLCGGCCSCATCHVYISTDTALPPPSDDERQILEGLRHQQPSSRLLCQLDVGVNVGVASSEITITLAEPE